MPWVLQRVGEQVPGAAVEVGRADDVVAGLGDVLDRHGRGRLAGGDGQRRDAAFERRDALLQHGVGRVHDARVDVAELLQREQVRGMLGVAELVGRGLIDRHRHRVGGGVGAVAAAMQDDAFPGFLLLGGHVGLPRLPVFGSCGCFRPPAVVRRR